MLRLAGPVLGVSALFIASLWDDVAAGLAGTPWALVFRACTIFLAGYAGHVMMRYYLRARSLIWTDFMTGARNRRFFEAEARRLLALAKRQGCPVSFVMMDLDHLKAHNDANGHQAGDRLLRQVADLLGQTARESDVVARLGGDEFAAVLPGADDVGALRFAVRVRESLHLLGHTVSIGIATHPNDGSSLQDLLANADTALYRAKICRDRIEVYSVMRVHEESQREDCR